MKFKQLVFQKKNDSIEIQTTAFNNCRKNDLNLDEL